jgi:endo-1,4-beta-xylanase
MISSQEAGLKDYFLRHGISYGMAAEGASFDSAVQRPILLKHASTVTSEVSLKMDYTQKAEGEWNYSEGDYLIEKARAYGLDVIGHCVVWHLQTPTWLEARLAGATMPGRENLLREHVRRVVSHFAPQCVRIDLVNELQPAVKVRAGGFGYYLGLEAARIAFDEARRWSGGCALDYNSFFPDDGDAAFAVSLLDVCDGIGVQLHLATWVDYRALFERVRWMAAACREKGKQMRLSEISVRCKGPDGLARVGQVYGEIVDLALELSDVVVNVTQWGVKGVAWNGGLLPFDSQGRPNQIYDAIVARLMSEKQKIVKKSINELHNNVSGEVK